MKIASFFIGFLCFISVSAQQKAKPLFGTISDGISLLNNVHILNKTTNRVTYSNSEGKFKTIAKVNDTLQLSFIGYQNKIMIVTANHFGITENRFRLTKEIIKLDEIEIKNHNLTGNLTSDAKQIKKETKVDAISLNIPFAGVKKRTQAERRIYTATTSQAGIPLDLILNILSGRLKKIKKLNRLEKKKQKFNHLKNRFKNYMISDLKIDSININRFIYYCMEDKSYRNIQKDEMFLINYFQKKSIEFKKLNKKP